MLDGEQVAQAAHDVGPAGVKQICRAVLALGQQAEGLDAGAEPGAPLGHVGLLRAQFGGLRLQGLQCGGGALVVGVEVVFGRAEARQ